jgi:hypothetical protein
MGNAEFGLMSALRNRAKRDLGKLANDFVEKDLTDAALKTNLKRAAKKGEKIVGEVAQQRGNVYKRYLRKKWNTDPKFRRNVIAGGVIGGGLIGLPALAGVKAGYDIASGTVKGINRMVNRKKETTNYSMGNYNLADFAEEKESEKKRWGRAAALMATGGVVAPLGGVVGLGISAKNLNKTSDKLDRIHKVSRKTVEDSPVYRGSSDDVLFWEKRARRGKEKTVDKLNKMASKLKLRRNLTMGASIIGGATLAGAGTYGAYRGAKALINKVRGKKEAKYSLGEVTVNFAQKEQQKKKVNLKKWAAIGGAGLLGTAGLAAGARYGGAALKYRKALKNYNIFNSVDDLPKGYEKYGLDDFAKDVKTKNMGGAQGQLTRDVYNLKKRLGIKTKP